MLLKLDVCSKGEGGSTGAAPTLSKARLRNASVVEPLLHGDGMTGLSGIYAVINAIRLALADRQLLTAADVHTLMSAGFRYVSGRLTPSQVFSAGCRVSVWRGLVQAMVETACIRFGANMRVDRLIVQDVGRVSAFAIIEQAIQHWQPVLMLCRGGRYTVVSGFTPSSLLVFDSDGARWMAKHACGVPRDKECARHMLYPGSFMALSA